MADLTTVNVEYVYMTIPADYVCVYHRILAMLADYGEDMLMDCKAACKDRNSNVIDCFNMFNAAVAARKIGKEKLAETIIKYVKAKIDQIYNGNEDCPGYVYPIDNHGELKAIVSCTDDTVKFEVIPSTGELVMSYNPESTVSDFEIVNNDLVIRE